MKLLYLIPARGGSKGIAKKNIKPLGGKPLIQYTLEALGKITKGSEICVSTNSEEIRNVVESLGFKVPFLRPEELSHDTATTEMVINHALEYYASQYQEFDLVVLLQPTSPFRTSKHIVECISLMESGIDMVVSVKLTDSSPYYVLFEENESGYLEKSKRGNFSRRQDCPNVYELNGAVYVIRVDSFRERGLKGLRNLVKYEMSKWDSVDIDDLFDWHFCEMIIEKQYSKNST
ncbi:MAG: CMP-N,N'-diacetyllegionaminic acid synthase [Cyclobacteriaceae bacterium]|jgi:N-acylneuraminate cytidylyltransferase